MNTPRFIRAIVPPPRRAVTWRSAAPLIGFVAVFVVACAALELFDVVLFSSLKPFALLVLAPWLWWMYMAGGAGLRPMRAATALMIRLIVLGLFIMLLAEPRAVRTDRDMAVVFVVDTSSSITPQAQDAALSFVASAASQKPEKDQAGLVVFGRDAAVELPPSMSFPLEAINVQVDKDGSDLSNALSLAAAVLPEEKQGRIVLISDGIETAGNVAPVLDDLKGRRIAVDVLPIQYSYEHEVWLERLEMPRFVKAGETYEAAVILSSLQDGAGRLTLTENGKTIFEDDITYSAGKNRFAVPIYLRQPGYYEYAATITPPPDRDNWTRNNIAISYLYLEGQGKVLLVIDPAGDRRDWADLAQTLRDAEREVEIISAYDMPRDALAMLPYDCIIFANVGADAFDIQQLQAVHDAVAQQGSGFLMVGGENSFGPGGYARTPVEMALPVTMDISQKKILPKGALAIILHTCEFPQGNTWGKEITKRAMKVLSPQDEVGVLAFDWQGGEGWVFPLTPASEYNRLALLVNNAQIGDMPSFATTMQLGLSGLKASDAATKHMIIISDGDPSPPPSALLNEFIANKISVSTVAIFPHENAVPYPMRAIADLTGGRYYYPKDPNTLPAIFVKEAKTLRRTAIQNRVFIPSVQFSSPILKGLDALPPLRGYVMTTPKPNTITILDGPEQEDIDPVLSTWRYGLGATAAFTSDLSTNWGADWVAWAKYEPFVKQLITEISRTKMETQLRLRTFAAAGEGVIVVEDYSTQASFLELHAQVRGPRSTAHSLRLNQTGPQRYEGRFPLSGEGRYQVAVVAAGAGNSGPTPVHGGFVLPYSQEFLRFRSNPIALEQVAERTAGRMLLGQGADETVYTADRRATQSSRPIFDWFLLLLACLIPLDVAVRRVQIDWALIRSWLSPRVSDEPADARFGALLSRKKQVSEALRGGQPDAASSVSASTSTVTSSTRPAAQAQKASKPPGQASDEPPSDRPMSMTERLLAAKRRAQDEYGSKDKKK